MKVIDILKKNSGKQFSIEVEPPVLGANIDDLYKFLDPLVNRGIKYVNITYHAEEIVDYVKQNNFQFPISRRKKPGTVGVAVGIRERYAKKIEPVPHVICTGFTRYDTEEYLVDLGYMQIENVMVLRGDGPKDSQGKRLPFKPTPGGHSHANQLIEQIVDLRKGKYVGAEKGHPLNFCIGAACYLEGHPESRQKFRTVGGAIENELYWSKVKVEAGAEYLVTQMFFDNCFYKKFVEKARELGIQVPIVPGIKPLYISRHVETLPSLFGCSIPEELKKKMIECGDDKKAVREVGMGWCVEQCKDLFDYGVPGIHFFATSGKPVEKDKSLVEEIIERIR